MTAAVPVDRSSFRRIAVERLLAARERVLWTASVSALLFAFATAYVACEHKREVAAHEPALVE